MELRQQIEACDLLPYAKGTPIGARWRRRRHHRREIDAGLAALRHCCRRAPGLERARFLDPSFRLTVKLGHYLAPKSRQFAKGEYCIGTGTFPGGRVGSSICTILYNPRTPGQGR